MESGPSETDKKLNTTMAHSPISRCPFDVLMYLFEMLMEDENETMDEFEVSTTLSHVSPTWRQVALSMPRLWENIEISCVRPVKDIRSFLDRTAPRVKSRPVYLCITDIDFGDDHSLDLSIFQFGRFPFIKRLTLEMWGTDSLTSRFMKPTHAFHKCQVEEISLDFSRIGEQYSWSCNELLRHFPSVFEFSVQSASENSVDPVNAILPLRFIIFNGVRVNILSTLQHCPQLEELEIDEFFDVPHSDTLPIQPIVMEHLKVLDIGGKIYDSNMPNPWNGLVSCPALHKLYLPLDHIANWILFIAAHPSIRFLETCSLLDIAQVVTAAPQLESIQVDLRDQESLSTSIIGENIQALPSLKTLELFDSLEGVIDVTHFDTFVSTRCLPSSHPKSRLHASLKPLEELRILIDESGPKDRKWMKSEYYHEAEKVVEEEEDVYFLTLSWS